VSFATEHYTRALVLGVDAREPGEEHFEHLAVQPVEEEFRKRGFGQTHQPGGLLHQRLADVVRGLVGGVLCVPNVERVDFRDVVGDVKVVVAHQSEKRRALRLRDGLGDSFVIPRGPIVLVGTRARARPRAERGERGEVRVLAPGRELGLGHRAGARRDRRRSAREAHRDATRNVNTGESASPRGGDVSEIAAARLEAREARDARGERRDGEDGHGG